MQWQIRANGNTKYGRRRQGRRTPIRAKAQDTRANPNSWKTHLVRKRWGIGLLRHWAQGLWWWWWFLYFLFFLLCPKVLHSSRDLEIVVNLKQLLGRSGLVFREWVKSTIEDEQIKTLNVHRRGLRVMGTIWWIVAGESSSRPVRFVN